MKIIRLLAWALVLVLLLAGPAAANTGPDLSIVFFPALIMFLFLISLSLAGGAYPILARLDPNRSRWWRTALRGVGSILLVPLSFLAPLALAPLFWFPTLWSLYRGVQMIRWARQARSSTPRPGHLITANPRRLGAAGVLLIVLSILLGWAGILLLTDQGNKAKATRAVSDAKTAVTQSIVYANDHKASPTSMKALRDAGYANIADKDPWSREWVLSPVLTQGGAPKAGDDVYVYSKGPCGTGTYEPTRWRKFPGGYLDTGKCGAVGYSSIHGSFQSSR